MLKKVWKKFKSLGKKKMLAIILSVTLGITALTGAGVTLARYAREEKSDSVVSAKSFYFESNKLKEGGVTYDGYGMNTISFDLVNYPDEQRLSEVDITYSVSITCSDSEAQIPAGVNTSGTISASAQNKVTVSYSGLEYGKTYTVTANATAPYTKTLSATFIIAEEDSALTYTIADMGAYALMVINNADYVGNVNITWQNGYVPDNSDAIMTNATGTSHTAAISNDGIYEIRFYKSNLSTEFNESAFAVTIS